MRHIRHCVYFRVSSLTNQATWLIKLFFFFPLFYYGEMFINEKRTSLLHLVPFPVPLPSGCCPVAMAVLLTTVLMGCTLRRSDPAIMHTKINRIRFLLMKAWTYKTVCPSVLNEDRRGFLSQAHTEIQAKFSKLLSKCSGLLKIQPPAQALVTEHWTSIWLTSQIVLWSWALGNLALRSACSES